MCREAIYLWFRVLMISLSFTVIDIWHIENLAHPIVEPVDVSLITINCLVLLNSM